MHKCGLLQRKEYQMFDTQTRCWNRARFKWIFDNEMLIAQHYIKLSYVRYSRITKPFSKTKSYLFIYFLQLSYLSSQYSFIISDMQFHTMAIFTQLIIDAFVEMESDSTYLNTM